MANETITVAGAGIAGLWQALTLARRGHGVRLVERSEEPFGAAASALGGAMLAPYCETEAAGEESVRELGLRALDIWRKTCPEVISAGTLVLAMPRDRGELRRFARLTQGHETVSQDRIGALEPDLAERFSDGLFFAGEAHVVPRVVRDFLFNACREAGVKIRFGQAIEEAVGEGIVVDCRGMAARDSLPSLRGVRGEMAIVRTKDITLSRPVRLLHPRAPIYIVPRRTNRFMIGATMIESEDRGEVRLRSALDLLSTAYALHPAFGEAEVLYLGADLRPAFPDNQPHVIARGDLIHVNGMYRHGFLLAPVLAELVADYIEKGTIDRQVFRDSDREW